MREELKLLEELQQVDLQLQEAEKALEELPAKLESMRRDVGTVEALLGREHQQLADTEKYRSDLDQSLRQEQDHVNKAKTKLSQVRTSREYMAVQRELETNRRLISDRDGELSKLTKAIEETQGSIAQHEKDLEELHRHLREEEQATEVKLAECRSASETQRSDRQELASRVGKSLLRKYDRIRKMRGGLAVVRAEGGVCTGCRMQLPPQLYNMLQRFDTIEQCPNCQRIVFFEVESTTEDEPASPSTENASSPTA